MLGPNPYPTTGGVPRNDSPPGRSRKVLHTRLGRYCPGERGWNKNAETTDLLHTQIPQSYRACLRFGSSNGWVQVLMLLISGDKTILCGDDAMADDSLQNFIVEF